LKKHQGTLEEVAKIKDAGAAAAIAIAIAIAASSSFSRYRWFHHQQHAQQ
jgi:hypothetical protein